MKFFKKEKQPGNPKKKKRGRNFLIVVLTIMITYTVVNVFPVRLISIRGNSMLPTYKDTQIVWAKKIYPFKDKREYRNITYGDIVVTYKKGMYIIKRVVGCPGDTVLIENGLLYINGKLSDYNNGYDRMNDDGEYNNVVLDSNEYYLLGDNRNHSDDSRVIGPVSNITYKILN